MGGTPESHPKEYEESSVMHYVDGIEWALLLVHGLMDENVHFRHSARLTQALTEAQKSYEMLCFPKERHSPRSLKDRTYMEQQVFAFLQKWLQ
jgi:dipeptidyl-peptidase-4